MIHVLQVVGKLHRAGQETITMNIYRAIDREAIQFDFLVHTHQHCEYDDEAMRLGGRLFHVDKIQTGPIRYIRAIRDIVRKNDYDVVHLHTAHSAGVFVLLAAKLGGARVRIAHSRNNSAELPWLHYLLRPLLRHYATHRFACSQLAGRWMFGCHADFRVLKNAIDTQAFRYSPDVRARKRAELDLGDCLTLGHVGRFTKQKNHPFLLEICAAVKARVPQVRLLLIGDGEDMQAMRLRAEALGIADNVVFLGSRPDVNELMQAMDVFVFPSLYEGFGNVAIEAQAAGLPCLVADTLSRETAATDRIAYLPITQGTDAWVEAILSARAEERAEAQAQVADAGFDVKREALEYAQIYQDAVAALPLRRQTERASL